LTEIDVAAVPQEQVTPTVSAEDLSALQQAVVKFDRTQLIWSSGYLAGLAGSTAPAAPLPVPDSGADPWHVFYATETGNSRQVAEELATRASAAGVAAELHDLSNTRPRFLKTVENAVFVLATHGIGEAPEGSEAFFEYWFSDKAPRLPKLNYSVLALGDSSYADFCEMGRLFDARLNALGATAVVERVECDLEFESPADTWTDSILEQAHDDAAQISVTRPAQLTAVASAPAYSKRNPFSAEILQRQVITGRDSSKQVQHIELDLEGSDIAYQPGDSLAVWPSNPPDLVEMLAQVTGLDANSIAAKEITVLSRPILNAVAANHSNLQSILEDRSQFAEYLATHQLIDVAHEFPVDWQNPIYVDALRQLSPRSYSIASSPDANPDEAHLTVAVVDYDKFGRRHLGAASNFLIGDTTRAPVFVEANENFRLPTDTTAPVIMIGAGTGVAPYRAFVEHRREHGHSGDNWLVFGDRNLSSDFLYQLEWLRYRKEGSLTNLDVAFSRDQVEKIYVQDRLIENGRQVYDWLERGAHVYVCGDAQHMAGDVHESLLAILRTHAGHSDDQAVEYIKRMKQSQRYQRDVY
jgi:sulfite reductase (NADPH) flavoprotein alpha-component